jgi:hypothetical protein
MSQSRLILSGEKVVRLHKPIGMLGKKWSAITLHHIYIRGSRCILLTETSLTPIQKFYSGCSVFVTGGTGFLGTILIEKLLRSCSDLSTIYVLARNKKGKNLQSRIDELFDQSIFDRLKEEFPKFRHKVVAIGGDCGLPDLGISLQDRQMLINEVGGERIGKKSEAEEHSKNRMIF